MSTPVPDHIQNTNSDASVSRAAGFSRDRRYRYWLSREWDATRPHCVFVGLNPSTADSTSDDPTIRRIMGFAQRWGYGGVLVVNLFAFRATHPHDLKLAEDPIGPRNNRWLRQSVRAAPLVVAAWGNHGAFRDRHAWFLRQSDELRCLGRLATGQPRHPLYARADTQLILYP